MEINHEVVMEKTIDASDMEKIIKVCNEKQLYMRYANYAVDHFNRDVYKRQEEEKKQYIAHNPRYGEIICRCEQVSAQEIIDCIKRSCGARSVVGVKKRVRPGMGDCQGGFCEPLVVRLLSETLKIPMEEVDYNQKGSHILYKMTKGER